MTYQNYQEPPPYQQTSSMAVVSLIAGIASYSILPLLGAIAAIVTGNLAQKEIRESAGHLTGEGMARAGMILGWINIGLSVIGLCMALLVFFSVISLPLCLVPLAVIFNY